MSPKRESQEYEPLSHTDERLSSSANSDEHEDAEYLLQLGKKPRVPRVLLFRILEAFVVINSLIFGILGTYKWQTSIGSESQKCPIDPFFRPEAAHLTEIQFDWTRHLSGYPSFTYMGEPTLEREKAWDILLQNRTIELTASDIAILNTTGNIPSLAGERTGSGTYIGYNLMSGVDYELHCLGLIRQWSYWDYYQRQMDELPEVYLSSIEDTHDLVDTCIETLRLQILCSSNSMRLLVPNATSTNGFQLPIAMRHEQDRWKCALPQDSSHHH